jgi:uncharacterized repeat protein (TIGR04138 family)
MDAPSDPLGDVAERDRRYAVEAYRFLFESLEYTVRRLNRAGHVTGRELLQGIREKALEEFGGLARMVFERWGIRRTDDFGEMVFALVDAGLMGKTDADSKADFANAYDFAEAFPLLGPVERKV